jgi:anaerobic magnesium-protoporphyrin IX monomethyl ester cyclase
MKLLFIRPGSRINGKPILPWPMTHPPLGLLYIGSVLEKEGHSVEILDHIYHDTLLKDFEKSINSSDAIGISFIDNCKPTADIAKLIKEINPKIPIVIGGSYCTFLPKQSLLDVPEADICVVGEGEQVFIDIIRYLKGQKKLKDISGIYYRQNKSIKQGKQPKVIEDLDSIPFPARKLVEKYDYGISPIGYKLKKNATAIITARGCPFNCRFCAKYSNAIKNWRFRQRSAKNVFEEIKEISQDYRSIMIVDDNLLADKKRAHEIFDLIIEEDINVEFFIEGARVDTADRKLYLKMKKAGVKLLLYGIESGNQDVLDFYNKKITLKQIKDAVNLAREMDFFIYASFIFGAPIETEQHLENTIKFARSLPIDFALFNPLRYLIGSSLWLDAVKNKKFPSNIYTITTDSKFNLGKINKEQLLNYTIKAYKEFYYRPTYLFPQIFRSIVRKDFSLLYNGLKFFPMINK